MAIGAVNDQSEKSLKTNPKARKKTRRNLLGISSTYLEQTTDVILRRTSASSLRNAWSERQSSIMASNLPPSNTGAMATPSSERAAAANRRATACSGPRGDAVEGEPTRT